MLIIPLHRKPTLANLPFFTLLLIIANVFVYTAMQRPDDLRAERAQAAYFESELPEIELPRYRQWLQQRGELPATAPSDEGFEPTAQMFDAMNEDQAFFAVLDRELATGDPQRYQNWRASRALLAEDLRPSFTSRHVLRYGEVAPGRMFSAMFLHGDYTHLIGNMVFLFVLGLVVEPALGGLGFLSLYLLAGMGGAAFTLLWRGDTVGGAPGASGAIAGLMGAYAVIWGLRKVRFFYWFFVVMDYTRARALWLLPAWLGWELFHLLFDTTSNIGFDAHAGGIASGALLALAAKKLGLERRQFLDEEVAADDRNEQLAAGLAELGKLQLAPARARFDGLIRKHPEDPEVIEPWLRCWLYARDRPEARAAADHAIAARVRGPEAMARQWRWYGEIRRCWPDATVPSLEVLIQYSQRLAMVRQFPSAAEALGDADRQPGQSSDARAALATAWFRLALAAQAAHQESTASKHLLHVRQRYPESPEASKAALLLAQ